LRRCGLRFHKRSRDKSAKRDAFATGDGDSVVIGVLLKGFLVVTGRRKTFTIRGDLRKNGKRVSSIPCLDRRHA